MTHCGIDGYSRMVVFLHCSTNNRASTVYSHFLQATHDYGTPSRVRTDQGKENTLVAQHMLEHRGTNRGSMIVGSSVHNQRIERFWRDMHRCVTILYYRLFYYLEYHGLLDPVNEIHLFSLHYVYLPRLNRSLKQFASGWNCHSIRTEHAHSPLQLYTSGVLLLQRSGLTALDFLDAVDESEYGIEEDGLIPEDSEDVVIPEARINLSPEQMRELEELINPFDDSANHGIELYQAAVQFVETELQI